MGGPYGEDWEERRGGDGVSDDVNGRRRERCQRCGQVDVYTACRGSELLAAEPSFPQGQGGTLLGRNNRALIPKRFAAGEPLQ